MSDEQDKANDANAPTPEQPVQAPEPADEAPAGDAPGSDAPADEVSDGVEVSDGGETRVDASALDADGGQSSDAASESAVSEDTRGDAAPATQETAHAVAAPTQAEVETPPPIEEATEAAVDATTDLEQPEVTTDEGAQAAAAEAAEPAAVGQEAATDEAVVETTAQDDADEPIATDRPEDADAFDAAADEIAKSSEETPDEAAQAAPGPAASDEKWTDPLADVDASGSETEAGAPDGEDAAETAPVEGDAPDSGPDAASPGSDAAGDAANGATDETGTPIEVLPLEVAEAMAQSTQRRRRLSLFVVVPALVVGVFVLLTQVRLGGGSSDEAAEVRDWKTGMALLEAGDVPKGIGMLESAVANLPQGAERAKAHVRLADEYRRLGETEPHYFNSAIRHYTSALDWAESAVAENGVVAKDEIVFRTGQCFSALGSYEIALEFYDQIETEFPRSMYRAQSRFEAGEALLAIGQYERGRRMLAEVATAYRGDPLGEEAFFRFADSFHEQARSLEAE